MTGRPLPTHVASRVLGDFFARVRTAPARLLLLDYDGTLAPFHVDPAKAVPYPGVRPLLDALIASGHTRVVIVSGRWTRDLVPLLNLRHRPEIWGSHGWERLHANGEYEIARIHPAALQGLVAADDWIAGIEALGARAERKPASIAVHWRGLSSERIAEVRARLLERWRDEPREDNLMWHDFDGGIELRVAGCNKRDVVTALAGEVDPDAAVAYLGDDSTDEDAFRAMPDAGLAILVRPEPRPSAAGIWLRPPEQLIDFLTRWLNEAPRR
jgi:trehalose-phosphatase